jgi:predicted hydrocarbon binding protein
VSEKKPVRRLPVRYVYQVLRAIETEIGAYSLQLMQQQAGLLPCTSRLRTSPSPAYQVSEFAALQKSIRDYYGQGARGILNRAGHQVWHTMIREASPVQKVKLLLARLLPIPTRCRVALELLVTTLRLQDSQITLQKSDKEWILTDTSSISTYGQTAENPICWLTLGEIQEALAWAGRGTCDVEEIACLAAGSETCKFRILI